MTTYRISSPLLLLPLVACVWSCESGDVNPNEDLSSDTPSDTSSTSETATSTSATGSSSRPSTTSAPSSTRDTGDSATSQDENSETLPQSSSEDNTTPSDSDAATTETTDSNNITNSSGGTDSTSSDTTSDTTDTTRFAFVVSVGGVVRALRMDPGAQPEEVADHQLDVTAGDFFIAATGDGSRVFVSYEKTVMALAFDAAEPAFTELDTATTAGAGTYVEVSPDGEHVIVAHYNEGKATHVGFDGMAFDAAAESSPGMNAHSARVHASGQWAYVPCLGSNHVAQFALGETLTPNTPPSVSVPGGPRHMTFHPNGKVAYVLTELTGQAYAFAVNDAGTLGPDPLDVEEVSDEQQPSGSDVQITPDGKHLYTFIRRNQQLYHFDVNQDGTLAASGDPTNFGQEVRNFAISPTGDLLLGGGSGGVLYTYAIDAGTGALTRIGEGLTDLLSVQATVIRDIAVSL